MSNSRLEVFYEKAIYKKNACGGEITFLVPTTLLAIVTVVKNIKCNVKRFY